MIAVMLNQILGVARLDMLTEFCRAVLSAKTSELKFDTVRLYKQHVGLGTVV